MSTTSADTTAQAAAVTACREVAADVKPVVALARVARRPEVGERQVFLWSCIGIIVYLVLAYLVFVRPGVSRVDHVLAMLLPASIIGLSAELYPRMVPGLRASLALLYGAFALVTGAVCVERLRVEGMSPGAVCGLLPLVAGVLLLVLGVRLAWTSRKRGGPLWRTVLRRALVAVAALLVVYWVVLPVSLAIVATERPAQPVKAADLGRPYKSVTLVTRDGVRLSAWYVPSQNDAAIVLFPRETAVPQARMLAEHGYGVLLVDPRGYGQSEGDPNAYGWGSTKDIDAAVVWLRNRPDVQKRRIGGLGLSVGGEQMLEAAAQNGGLKAVVSEGAGIRSVLEAPAERGLSPLERILSYPQDLVQTASVWLLGGETVPMSLKTASLLISPRSVLFIYGQHGQEVEKAVNPVYFSSAVAPKVIWEVTGSGHTEGIRAQPKEYEHRVVGFFDQTLLPKE